GFFSSFLATAFASLSSFFSVLATASFFSSFLATASFVSAPPLPYLARSSARYLSLSKLPFTVPSTGVSFTTGLVSLTTGLVSLPSSFLPNHFCHSVSEPASVFLSAPAGPFRAGPSTTTLPSPFDLPPNRLWSRGNRGASAAWSPLGIALGASPPGPA